MELSSKDSRDDFTLEDVAADPTAFGIPSFEDYCRNRDFYFRKFFGHHEDVLATADKASKMLDRHEQKRRYELWTADRKIQCKTLEEVQKAAFNEGIDLRVLQLVPEVIDKGAGKCDILVRFMTKEQLEKRRVWERGQEKPSAE